MSKKILTAIGAIVICIFCIPMMCMAASRQPVHNVSYFHYAKTQSDDGLDILRIEIGFDRPDVEYTAAVNQYKPKQLLLDLSNTKLGDIRQDITLDGKFARYMTFRELEARHTQVMISFGKDTASQAYKVYTMPADRKAKKPYRLVIDITLQPPASPASNDKVEGVLGRTIVIDPGHGGSDSGAVGPDGVQEKDVTLAVAKDVKAILENSGARIVMTHDGDTDVYGEYATDRQELQARVNVGAYTPGMQVFLSIHANAFSSSTANGTETYYYPKTYYDGELAQCLQNELIASLGLRDRGICEANFYVVKHSDVPAALVELAFITNYNEEELLNSPDFQYTAALAIAKGLGEFFQESGY